MVFFHQAAYLKMCQNKFSLMGKNLPALDNGVCPKGRSFLLNLTGLINSKATRLEKGQYIYLASIRNYIDYHLKKDLNLDIRLVPEVPVDEFERNRLLFLDRQGKLHFYHEEKQHGN